VGVFVRSGKEKAGKEERKKEEERKHKKSEKKREKRKNKKRFKEKKNARVLFNLAVALHSFSSFYPHFQLSSSFPVVKMQRCACHKFILSKGGYKNKVKTYSAKELLKETTCSKKGASCSGSKGSCEKAKQKIKKIFPTLTSG
jgi:hypothetical protein